MRERLLCCHEGSFEITPLFRGDFRSRENDPIFPRGIGQEKLLVMRMLTQWLDIGSRRCKGFGCPILDVDTGGSSRAGTKKDGQLRAHILR